MKSGIELTTAPYADGRIVQQTFAVENDTRRIIETRIMDTRDAQIRNALITLGWTPPIDNGFASTMCMEKPKHVA